jgi:hypothetical protein
MRVAIHQPNFMPWLGWWHKAAMADKFILFDTVQYAAKQFQNRTQIRQKHGGMWLTVPTKKHQETLIKDVKIANEHQWVRPMLKTIQLQYQKAESLLKLNLFFIVECGMWLGISPKWVLASDLKTTGEGQQYLADLVKEVGGDQYVTGSTHKDYHEPEVFERAGIEVIDQNFQHPEYDQQRPGFVPDCSVVDLYFHYGPASKDIICERK